jgi:hypothetical protein
MYKWGVVFLLTIYPLQAHWRPEYAQLPQATQDWYSSRELTEAAQLRFHFKSCCAHSDTVSTQFRVNKTTGTDEWFWLNGGKWKRIPDDIIHWDQHAPDGQAVMFAIGDEPTCFFPPDAGG